MAEELRMRFIQGDSVFRLNHQQFSDTEVQAVLQGYIENCRRNSQWILDTREEGNTLVVEHLFPAEEFIEANNDRLHIDEAFVESLPLTYPIVFEIRSGYLRIHKPLANKYGALLSDFIRGLWEVLLQGQMRYLWDHGFAQCGGVGTIQLNAYGLLEPDEPLIGFYRWTSICSTRLGCTSPRKGSSWFSTMTTSLPSTRWTCAIPRFLQESFLLACSRLRWLEPAAARP